MNTELENLIFLGDCQNALSEDPVARDQGDKTMPIAVVGLSCRYPGEAKNPESLWQACAEERNLWQPIPKEKVNPNAFYHPNPSRNGTVRFLVQNSETSSKNLFIQSNARGGYFLDEYPGLFDAPFFNLTGAEASVSCH